MMYPARQVPSIMAKVRREWTKGEAAAYLRSIQEAMIPQSSFILQYFGVNERLEAAEKLRETQARAQQLLEKAPYSTIVTHPGTRPLYIRHALTLPGESVAMDLGLLLARALLETFPERLNWALGGKPKSDENYNLPVLAGVVREPGWPNIFNPLTFSFGMCTAALTNAKHADAIANVFEYLVRGLSTASE